MDLKIVETFTTALPGDTDDKNYNRQVHNAGFSYVRPKVPSQPRLIHFSPELLTELGMSKEEVSKADFLNLMSGAAIYPETKPYAMAYAGHQFGHWAGQLGDGRAINLFEVKHDKKLWAIQLKGAGKTPYSRQGDGLAVLRSSIREYLCSEAMHYLGVPTTRALSLVLTGDKVLRDILYDGNSAYEKGAITARVSPSFIRFGNFELFAARQDYKTLKILADYTITQFYQELGEPSKMVYIEFFRAVMQRTLDMVIHWQRVGFVHGVMNTDNMSILGLTIDYGPYGWLEGFDFGWTPNTTDRNHKRYRYGNQPNMALWNLVQLANALYPLIEDTTPLEAILEDFKTQFEVQSLNMMRAKIGLQTKDDIDSKLVQDLEDALLTSETDMTIFFRLLSQFKINDKDEAYQLISPSFYNQDKLTTDHKNHWKSWFEDYSHRLKKEQASYQQRAKQMNAVNPKYVLRNYMAQLAIDDAEQGNYNRIDELFQLLKEPYKEQPDQEQWFARRPEWARHKVGCSMLSCSS